MRINGLLCMVSLNFLNSEINAEVSLTISE